MCWIVWNYKKLKVRVNLSCYFHNYQLISFYVKDHSGVVAFSNSHLEIILFFYVQNISLALNLSRTIFDIFIERIQNQPLKRHHCLSSTRFTPNGLSQNFQNSWRCRD